MQPEWMTALADQKQAGAAEFLDIAINGARRSPVEFDGPMGLAKLALLIRDLVVGTEDLPDDLTDVDMLPYEVLAEATRRLAKTERIAQC